MENKNTMYIVEECCGDYYVCGSEGAAYRKALEILEGYINSVINQYKNTQATADHYNDELTYLCEGIRNLKNNKYIEELVYITKAEVFE